MSRWPRWWRIGRASPAGSVFVKSAVSTGADAAPRSPPRSRANVQLLRPFALPHTGVPCFSLDVLCLYSGSMPACSAMSSVLQHPAPATEHEQMPTMRIARATFS